MSGVALLQLCSNQGWPGYPIGRIVVVGIPGRDAVRLYINIWGHRTKAFHLNAYRRHALHVHNKGDIFTQNCSGACSHYKRNGQRHGLPGHPNCHSGDLGNVTFTPGVDVDVCMEKTGLTIQECVGRSFILHEGVDLGRTNPPDETGGAGGRLAAGVIGWA